MDYTAEMGFVSVSESSSVHLSGAPALERRERAVRATNLAARAAGGAGSSRLEADRFREAEARERSCPAVWREKLEHAARNPPPLRWAGPEQPALWTDVLAEMSRHIYIRNKIGEGIQAPIFQVRRSRLLGLNLDIRICLNIWTKGWKKTVLTQVT